MADLNGDHLSDLAAPGGSDNVEVLLGNGDGTFGPSVHYEAGAYPIQAVAEDFNGDDSLDLAVINYDFAGVSDITSEFASVSILINNGDGTFAPFLEYATGALPAQVAAGDFNGDDANDLVVASLEGNKGTVFVLLNNGNGRFNAPVAYGTGWAGSVAVGDFDGDQKADIAATKRDEIDVFLNQGGGVFGGPVGYSAGDHPTALVAAPLIPGGKPDLAVLTGGMLAVLPNNGDGTFGPASTYPIGERGAISTAVVDLNGDGAQDLAVVHQFGLGLIFLNRSDGTFGPPLRFGAGPTPFAVSAGDLNGDIKPDLVVANGNAGLALLLGKGDGRLASAPFFNVPSLPIAVAVGDFNGDRRKDVSALQYDLWSPGEMTILLATGRGRFAPPRSFAVGQNPIALAAADFNLDGHTDLAVVGANLIILLARGDGTFLPPVTLSLPHAPVRGIVAGDFNRDAKPDLAVAMFFNLGPIHVQAAILLGNGDGTFAPPVTYDGGRGLTTGIAEMDLDGDRLLDLALVGRSPLLNHRSTLSIFLGIGDGTFRPAMVTERQVLSAGLAAGDVNRDRVPDLAIIDTFTATAAVLLGAGDGTFGQETNYRAGIRPMAIKLGDTNGDGNRDVVVVGDLGLVTILTGDGDGTFEPSVTYANGSSGPPTESAELLALANLDRLPGLDIVVAQYGGGSVAILRQLPSS